MLWLIFTQLFVFFDTVYADDSHFYSWYDLNKTLNAKPETAIGMRLTSGNFLLYHLCFRNILFIYWMHYLDISDSHSHELFH